MSRWSPLLVGAGVSGIVYAATQAVAPDPTRGLFGASPSSTLELKSWLATGVLALAAFQLSTALWIYGRLRARAPAWVGPVHRVSGVLAILLSLPVAYHCLVAYGFETTDARTTVHALFGCFLYGAVAAKVLVVRARGLRAWALPVAGGTLLTIVVVLWYSSAAWYFNDFSVPIFGSSSAATTSKAAPASGRNPYGTPANVVAVTYRNYAISPAHVTIRLGQTVKWTNQDAATHNVVVLSGPAKVTSPSLGEGQTFSYKPPKPGLYHYICAFHPTSMRGTIAVRR